ncbi:MAG: carbon storage regulator [Candidatus Gastranaerophilales bacterium]|nr:carbon storage regulator [Candidatus Gastranaerophilales bacterium]
MLVLSRKNGQKIVINDNIEITILESRFDNCKIAIEAPRDVKIYREEVYKQIQLSNKMGNKASVDVVDSLAIFVNETSEVKKKTNKVIIKKK